MTILVLSKQNLDKGTSGRYTYNPDLVSKADYSKYWDGTYWVFLGVAEGNVHRNSCIVFWYCKVSQFSIIVLHHLLIISINNTKKLSDFVNSASCIPDAKKSLKMQTNSWHASKDRSVNMNMCVCRNIRTVPVISTALWLLLNNA